MQLIKLNKWTRAKEEELKIMDEEKKEAEDEIQNGDFELLDTTARYCQAQPKPQFN